MSEDARVEDAMVIEEAAEELPSGDGEDELFEDEAEDSGDGDSSDEDDDSAQDEFEKDGFVVDEAEEGEDEEDGIKKRRKKKRKERNDDLEDEELDLLEEAGVLVREDVDKIFPPCTDISSATYYKSSSVRSLAVGACSKQGTQPTWLLMQTRCRTNCSLPTVRSTSNQPLTLDSTCSPSFIRPSGRA